MNFPKFNTRVSKIFLLISIFLVVLFVIFGKSQQPETPQVTSKFTIPSVPDQLDVYQVSPQQINITSLIDRFSSTYKLAPVSGLPNYWANSNRSIILSHNPDLKSLEFKLDSYQQPQLFKGNSPPSYGSALEVSQEIVNILPPTGFDNTNPLQVEYLKYSPENLITSDNTDYEIIRLSFSPKIDGYALKNISSPDPPLTITVGQNNQIIGAKFLYELVSIGSGTSYDTISDKKARDKILSNEAQIIKISSSLKIATAPADLSKAEIEKVDIEYLYDIENRLAFPFFTYVALFPDRPESVRSVTYSILAIDSEALPQDLQPKIPAPSN